MRVPLPWLREYCDPALDVHGIEERLTMTGTKVEAIHRHGVPSGEHFVVGRVLAAEPHPDADRLRVCTVDLGLDEGPATIVCGAPNVAAGQTVAVARPGAVLPDGTKLKRAKLRGVASEGMILSESELQLDGGPSQGIMVLDGVAQGSEPAPGTPQDATSAPGTPQDAALAPGTPQDATPAPSTPQDAALAPGTPLERVLPLTMDVVELEVTSNRPDCLGVYGVARELHAATGAPLAPEPWGEDPGSAGPLAPGREGDPPPAAVEVRCPDLCPRFTARVFDGVALAPSPPWLKARLTAAGQRPVNNVVDVTNYVMLATGQPLHAFDLDRVAGARLTVRRARAGERVRTLDGQERTLDGEMVVIEDADGPTSIAGLMGGEHSEVQPQTTRVLLEAASWDGPNIHRTSLALGLRSEASGRFEKGLQPEQCAHALALASRLLVEVCGARLAPGTIDVGGADGAAWAPPAPQRLRLREARVRAILGVPVPAARQAEILTALDFRPAPCADGLEATVPALRRADVTREVDLIEEVARIDGLERLPATLPARRGAAGRLTHAQRVRRAAEDALAGRGLHEIAGWSFAEPGLLDRLQIPPGHFLRRVLEIENPLSDSQSIMRPTLLGSLLDAARHNVARNRPDVAIFESGVVHRLAPDAAGALGAGAADEGASGPGGEGEAWPVQEHHALGVLLTGGLAPRSWRGERREADFFAAKALLEELLGHLHVRWWVAQADWPFLHPGRSAAVLAHRPAGAGGGEGGPGANAGTADGAASMLGFLGELHPLVAREWGLQRTAAFALDLGELAAVAPEVSAFRAYGAFPVLHQDLAVTLPERVSADELLELVRAAGGELLEHAGIFDVYTGAQVGEGRRSLALTLTFRGLDRTLTDEDVAPVRARMLDAVAAVGGELRG